MLLNKLRYFAETTPNEPAFIGRENETNWPTLLHAVEMFKKALTKFEGKRVLFHTDGRFKDEMALIIASSEVPGEFILISSFHNLERTTSLMHEFNAEYVVFPEKGEIRILAERKPIDAPVFIAEPYIGILTSGTTGNPKCARYSWDRLSKAVAINPKFQNRRWMMSYHIANFAGLQVFLQCFCNGGCLVLPRNWPPNSKEDIDSIVENKIQYLNCTATYSRKIALSIPNAIESQVRSITLGGEVVDQSLIDILKKKFPLAKIIHIYASTEMGSRIEVKDELEGFPISVLERSDIRVFENEIQLRPSDRSMLSYLGAGQGEKVFNSVVKQINTNNWISTGDLVAIKGDRVLFLGRKDLLINVGGFKVNPTTVEAVIREIPGVLEVLVSGFKNPVSGSIVKAKIAVAKSANVDELKGIVLKICKGKLPYYSVPRLFEFTDHIVTTSSSKISRTA